VEKNEYYRWRGWYFSLVYSICGALVEKCGQKIIISEKKIIFDNSQCFSIDYGQRCG